MVCALRAAPLVRARAKIHSKNAVCASLRRQHTVFLTGIFTLTRTSGAVLRAMIASCHVTNAKNDVAIDGLQRGPVLIRGIGTRRTAGGQRGHILRPQMHVGLCRNMIPDQ